jgi:penicillin-binding protein 2
MIRRAFKGLGGRGNLPIYFDESEIQLALFGEALRTSDLDPVSIEVFNRQLRITTLVILAVFAILILRLWYMQVASGWSYRTKSENNRIHLRDIPPFRGMIFDRNGELLVDNRPSYNLCVIPEDVQDQERLLKSLNRMIGLDEDLASTALRKAARRQPFKSVCLKQDISRDHLAAIETHRFNLPGVTIEVTPQRFYLYGNHASHLLGYLGEIGEGQLRSERYSNNKAGDLIGMSGVEKKWQPALNGMRGGEQVEVDAAGRIISVLSERLPIPGANVVMTINRNLQALAEQTMADKKGAIVAMNPSNGGILALVSSPSFDPNLFVSGIDRAAWEALSTSKDFPLQNRALSGQYPPGSIFKIVVALAALEEGVIELEERIFCGGSYSLGRQRYRCWKRPGHGWVDLYKAIVGSCDVYFYTIGRRLGVDKIAQYSRKFGLGRKTGFELGHERSGLIPDRQWKLKRWGVPWQEGETVSTSIGQSFVLVTPIQMAALIAATFNGGVLYRPQVTKWVGRTEKEELYEFVPVLKRQVGIRQEYLEIVKKALVGVVNERRGTGKKARVDGITVAGKTGTAQVISLKKEKLLGEEGEVPEEFKDHAWFVAIAPAENPQIAVAVLVEHGGKGGRDAAPIAREIIKAYLKPEQIASAK